MFGKSRPDPRAQESAILQCRVSLRKLQVKYRTMLERETRIARELRAKNMSSPSNDTKIKINYYMLREIDKTMTRLSEIRDTAQLNDAMNEFAGVLASVNKLSARVDKADGKAISKNIQKMNKRAEKEEGQLSRILDRMEKNAGPLDLGQGISDLAEQQSQAAMSQAGESQGEIERAENLWQELGQAQTGRLDTGRMENGRPGMQEAGQEEQAALTKADLDEINRYVEEMIRTL